MMNARHPLSALIATLIAAMVVVPNWGTLVAPVVVALWSLYMMFFAHLNAIRRAALRHPSVSVLKEWTVELGEVDLRTRLLWDKLTDQGKPDVQRFLEDLPSKLKESEELLEKTHQLIMRGEEILLGIEESNKDGVRCLNDHLRKNARNIERVRAVLVNAMTVL